MTDHAPKRGPAPERDPVPERGPIPKRGLARNTANYGDKDFALYLRRSFAKSMGYSQAMLDRPVVGIVDTGSAYNNCHRTVPELIEAVKRGVLAAGGLPMPFPTVSLCEPSLFPTSMHYRNLAALDTEAMLTAQPMDAAVLVGGCDKTVPAQLMGAASADIPAVQLVTGPMLATPFQGERLSACTDCRRYWAQYRAGNVTEERIAEIEGRLATTAGTCGVMGTASTMACIAETLGMIPLGHGSIPAVHADRLRAAEEAGALAVRLIENPIRPSQIMTAHCGRKRAARAAGARRVDQRADPPDRDRRPAGREDRPAPAERAVRLDAGAGRSEADRRGLHGGLPCRRRHAGAAVGTARPAAPGPDRRHRRRPGRTAGRTAVRRSPLHPALAANRCRRSAASCRCSAPWRRAARS